jgi:hypothetical protein
MLEENKKSVSQKLMDEIEPISHPTEYDESDDIEEAKRADAKEVMSPLEIEAYKNVVSARWDWYGLAEEE